jgi:UDP-N-acetylmuramyl pentapeptide phosphotransferase/UDP-N-acetylglucosamine-1-phosphate transferase
MSFLIVYFFGLLVTLLIGPLLLSLLFVRLSVFLAHRYDVLARPSERGSHLQATPRLGGVGLALAFCLGLLTVEAVVGVWRPPGLWFYGMIVGGVWALVGGLLDDVLDLPAANKFLFQAIAALCFVLLGGTINHIHLPDTTVVILPTWLGITLAFCLVVFWINAFNFMDGMDGQAALFCMIFSLGIAMPVMGMQVISPVAMSAVLLLGCSFGFFLYNRPGCSPEKKTFLGDGGSHFLGLIMMALVIAAAHLPVRSGRPNGIPLLASMLLLLPFLWDVSYTILRRLTRGENIFKAHRTHLYQRLLVIGWSHSQALVLGHIPWLICFWLSQIYVRSYWDSPMDTPTRYACLLGGLTTMTFYTGIVLWLEKRAFNKSSPAVA